MILSLRHTGIVVQHLDRMISFYCDLLGFKVVKRQREPADTMDELLSLIGVRVETAKLLAPDGVGVIELLRFDSHPPVNPEGRWLSDAGLSHIALTVSNIDEEYERLCRHRVEFLSAPRVSGSAKLAFCLDPENNFIELTEVLH